MDLDLTQILLGLLGTTSLGGIYAAIAYRKENKTLRQNEVKKDDVQTQREQINITFSKYSSASIVVPPNNK